LALQVSFICGGVGRRLENGCLMAIQPAPHPLPPASNAIPYSDNIRTLLIKPVHPFDA
jgi:hypothetical protein